MWLLDRLANLVSGLGSAKDKTTGNLHVHVLRTPAELHAAYRDNWIAAKVVDVVPFDMLREWRGWKAQDAEVTAIEAAETALGYREKLLLALKRARLDGGAALLIGDGAADPSQELVADRLGKSGIRYLHVLGRYEITPGEIDRDPLSPYFGEPAVYEVGGADRANQRVHPSRVVRLTGRPILHAGVGSLDECWGDSVLQAVFDALDQATSSAAYVNAMLPEAKQDVISVPGLSMHLATEEGTKQLTERFAYAARMKSMFGMLLLEGDGRSPEGEIFQQKQLSFASLPDVVRMFLQIAAGAADIPVTRLLGQAPAGLNATGESDTRNYYDHVAARQKVELTPVLRRLDELLIRHALGRRPPEVWYDWNPLYQPSRKEKADAFKVVADAVSALAATALVPDEVAAKGVRGWLIDDGTLSGIEAAYDEYGEQLIEPQDDLDEGGRPVPGQPEPGSNVVPLRPRLTADAAPRTLYVSRKLKNAADLVAWAKSQGFTDLMPAGEMHVTIAYSRTPIDWFEAGQSWQGEELKVDAGGPRLIERFGEAVVLLFASNDLRWRWREIREAGASWDHEDYQPHVTFTWNLGDVDLATVQAYNGPLVFGPEIFAEVDENWRAKLDAAE